MLVAGGSASRRLDARAQLDRLPARLTDAPGQLLVAANSARLRSTSDGAALPKTSRGVSGRRGPSHALSLMTSLYEARPRVSGGAGAQIPATGAGAPPPTKRVTRGTRTTQDTEQRDLEDVQEHDHDPRPHLVPDLTPARPQPYRPRRRCRFCRELRALPGAIRVPTRLPTVGGSDGPARIRRYCVTPAIRRSTKRTSAGAGRSSGSVISSGSTSSTTRPRVSIEHVPVERTFLTHCASDP